MGPWGQVFVVVVGLWIKIHSLRNASPKMSWEADILSLLCWRIIGQWLYGSEWMMRDVHSPSHWSGIRGGSLKRATPPRQHQSHCAPSLVGLVSAIDVVLCMLWMYFSLYYEFSLVCAVNAVLCSVCSAVHRVKKCGVCIVCAFWCRVKSIQCTAI